MQIIMLIWNGISGLGAGTIMLKGLFILVLAAIFWMLCELIKFMVKVFAGLAVDALKYLAIMTRGWPKNEEDDRQSGTLSHGNRVDKGIR
jgi:hypothetical protein